MSNINQDKKQWYDELFNFIWSVADECLRDVYVRGKYRDIILPMTVIRRFDAVLESQKEEILKNKQLFLDCPPEDIAEHVMKVMRLPFVNVSQYSLKDLRSETNMQSLKKKFKEYLDSFSLNVRDILKNFEFYNQIDKMASASILDGVIAKFTSTQINLSPYDILDKDNNVLKPGLDNHTMGTLFEELIRRFNEENNEEAGEHFTPRDVVELMTDLAILPVLDKMKSSTYTLYDGACGTLGICTVAKEKLKDYANTHDKQFSIHMYGQEVNPETYAIAKADTLIKGDEKESDNIFLGSTISIDKTKGLSFDFMLSNPPYGKNWSTDLAIIGYGSNKELAKNVTDSRFVKNFDGISDFNMVPDVNDGQILFLLNNIDKMKWNSELGSRIVEVHNASPLFGGGAKSGANNARRYMIQNDLLEAVIQLPNDIFYNTGIATFLWILSNKKEERRQGKVQLIDASKIFSPLRVNLGQKSVELSPQNKQDVIDMFMDFKETSNSKIINNDDFGYWEIKVYRPLRMIVSVNQQTIDNLIKIYNEIIKNGEVNLELLARYDLKKSKDALGELQDKQKMDAYFDILNNLKKDEEYLDCKLFIEKFDKLALNFDIKGLSFGALEKTGLTDFIVIKDERGEIVRDKKGNLIVDKELTDSENVPITYPGGVEGYLKNEIQPHWPDAFIKEDEVEIGYEIPFTKYFYEPERIPTTKEVIQEIKELDKEMETLFLEITKGL